MKQERMNRRDFFKLAAGAGVLIATKDLPAVTSPKFEIGTRGSHSRISVIRK